MASTNINEPHFLNRKSAIRIICSCGQVWQTFCETCFSDMVFFRYQCPLEGRRAMHCKSLHLWKTVYVLQGCQLFLVSLGSHLRYLRVSMYFIAVRVYIICLKVFFLFLLNYSACFISILLANAPNNVCFLQLHGFMKINTGYAVDTK